MYKIYCKLRDEKGYKDSDVARLTGITKSTFSDWKSGRSNPKSEKLQRIADHFGVPINYFMAGNTEQESALTAQDERDIKTILSNTEQLLKQDGLMFDGKPASPESIESILSAMQIGMEMAKKKNKEKYTPKKHVVITPLK